MHVSFHIRSVAVIAAAKGFDNLFLGGILFETLRDCQEGFVALNKTVKIRPGGGNDNRLSGNLMR